MGFMSNGKWNNRSWVTETLEKQGLVDIEIKAQTIPSNWANLREFMDSIMSKIMATFPLKLWDKDDQKDLDLSYSQPWRASYWVNTGMILHLSLRWLHSLLQLESEVNKYVKE